MTRTRTALATIAVVASIATVAAVAGWASASKPPENRTIVTDQRLADLLDAVCVVVLEARVANRHHAEGRVHEVGESIARIHSTARSGLHAIGIGDEDILDRALDRDPDILRRLIDAKVGE